MVTVVLLVGFLILGLGAFTITIRLQAQVSGWNRLAEQFRFDGQLEGHIWKSRTANFRNLTTYWSSVTVGENARGLYLALGWPFNKLGHSPLLVPWGEVEIAAPKWSHLGSGVLFLGAALRIRMTLSRELCTAIARHIPNGRASAA